MLLSQVVAWLWWNLYNVKTWDPIETMIIDLENEVYASLKEWYTDISFFYNRIELTNQVVKNG